MSYLMKKLLETKLKEFKVKSINQELMKLAKYLCHVLTIKDTYQMMEFIRWLIFIKIVLQVVKRLKKIVIKKILIKKILLKKAVMIEKNYDN